MPTCITLNSNVDFTVTSLSAPQDGYSIAIAMATPSPTATPVPTPTPSVTAGPTPSPSATPAGTPFPTPSDTPVPTASTTPVPTPSPTSVGLCINVDGSTSNFSTAQLAGPENGFSFFNNVIANPTPTVTPVPPTPSPTPSGGGPISGASDCSNSTSWPTYGVSAVYEITFNNNTDEQWFTVTPATGRTLYMDNNTGGATRCALAVDLSQPGDPIYPCDAINFVNSPVVSLQGGVVINSGGSGNFGLRGSNGTFPQTWDIWIV